MLSSFQNTILFLTKTPITDRFINVSHPKISIVTPSYNQAPYLEATIRSILDQGYPNLEYIIIDGGSTDGSVEIIKKYEKQLTYWESQSDKGMYDALQKGFEKSTGEIMGWLNSDDLLHPKSLFVLADIFSNNAKVNWVQGYPTVFDESGRVVHTRSHKFSKYSFYLKEYLEDDSFIQQESTYWRRELWQKAGSYVSQEYKLAADFELWLRFFRYETLFTSEAPIGAFRIRRSNQKSLEAIKEYIAEVNQSIKNEKLSPKEKQKLQFLNIYEKYFINIPWIGKMKYLRRIQKNIYQYPSRLIFDRQTYKFTFEHLLSNHV